MSERAGQKPVVSRIGSGRSAWVAALTTVALLACVAGVALASRVPVPPAAPDAAEQAAVRPVDSSAAATDQRPQTNRRGGSSWLFVGAILLVGLFELAAVLFAADSRDRRLNQYRPPPPG